MTQPRVMRPESWRRQFIADNNARCHYCNRSGSMDIGPDERPWHIDHKQPLARGGADEESNLALACKRCNLTKNVQLYEQFKEFARAAYWVPSDWRASEFELDRLIDLYHQTADDGAKREPYEEEPESLPPDSTWHQSEDNFGVVFTDQTGKQLHVLEWMGKRPQDPDSTTWNRWERDVADHGHAHIDLVVLMRRLLPALVAEIRMLRESEREAEAA